MCGSFCVSSFFCLFTHSFSRSSNMSCRRRRPSNQSFFCLVCPFSFFPENVLRRENERKKKPPQKKKKKEEEERKRVNQRTLLFSEPSFKSLVVVCGTRTRRHGRRLVKKGTKKKRKEGRNKRLEAKDRPDRNISPSRRWVKLHHYTRRDVCFHVKPKRDERQRLLYL